MWYDEGIKMNTLGASVVEKRYCMKSKKKDDKYWGASTFYTYEAAKKLFDESKSED